MTLRVSDGGNPCKAALRLTALILVAACARGPVVIEEAPEPVVCRRGSDCAMKWQRVHDWVVAHSRWPIRQDTDTLIATEGPGDTRDAAFVIHRVPNATVPDLETIVFAAGCTDRVRAFVDHVPARGDRWRNVTGPKAQYTECEPPVDELEASFVRFVGGREGVLPP